MSKQEERLNSIETSLSHQELQLQDLHEVIRMQWREIDILKAKLRITESKIEDIELSSQNSGEKLSTTQIAARDKPPHY